MKKSSKSHYYTNGEHEIRIKIGDPIPDGYYLGRVCGYPTTTGYSWYNDGSINKLFAVDAVIPNTFVKGRLKFSDKALNNMRNASGRKRGKCYNNGVIEKHFLDDDIIPDGFIKGRLPVSDETRERQRQAKLGYKYSKESQNVRNFHTYITKKANKSFKSSNIEDKLYNYLVSIFGEDDVLHPYRDERYNFNCDFYIKSKDLFIELNIHWTHGPKPFNSSDDECLTILNSWIERSKNSQFYRNAINTWTIRDVNKLDVAGLNKINLKVIYPKDLDKINFNEIISE